MTYTEQVLSGKVVACEKIKQACKRFKDDLAKSASKDFPYYYDKRQAKKAVDFISLVPKTDGTKLILQPFQVWLISQLFGWREKATGYRRFTQAFISMSRKNGKTFLISAIAILSLLMEKVPARGRQIVFSANSAKQAHLGYDMATNELKQIAARSRYMRRRVKIQKQAITDTATDSTMVAVASDTNTLDGLGPSLAVIDEWHEAKTRELYDVLKSGMINTPNALLAVISTCGLDLNSPMYEEYKLVSKVLAGKLTADRYFIAIWEQDNKEEVNDPNSWIKSNPLMSEPHVKQRMTERLQADLALSMAQENLIPFLVKNMNVWQQAREDSYISIADWEKNQIPTPVIDEQEVYIGVDLSKTNDLTAISWLVPIGEGKFYVGSHSWIGTKYGLKTKEKRDRVNYRALEQAGECSITKLDSGVIDYEDMFNWLQTFIEEHRLNVRAICYDPYNATTLITKCEKAGYPLVEIRQGTLTLNVPTREFKERVYQGKIVHSGGKLLTYAIGNAIVKVVNNGWQLDKARNTNRIDPIAALMNAYVIGRHYYDNKEGSKNLNDYYTSEAFTS